MRGFGLAVALAAAAAVAPLPADACQPPLRGWFLPFEPQTDLGVVPLEGWVAIQAEFGPTAGVESGEDALDALSVKVVGAGDILVPGEVVWSEDLGLPVWKSRSPLEPANFHTMQVTVDDELYGGPALAERDSVQITFISADRPLGSIEPATLARVEPLTEWAKSERTIFCTQTPDNCPCGPCGLTLTVEYAYLPAFDTEWSFEDYSRTELIVHKVWSVVDDGRPRPVRTVSPGGARTAADGSRILPIEVAYQREGSTYCTFVESKRLIDGATVRSQTICTDEGRIEIERKDIDYSRLQACETLPEGYDVDGPTDPDPDPDTKPENGDALPAVDYGGCQSAGRSVGPVWAGLLLGALVLVRRRRD